MAHGQWTEIEARGVMSALAKSGLSVAKFCEERGLTDKRVYWWRKKLGMTRKQQKAMALLPVRVVESAPPMLPAPAKRGDPVTVLLRSGHMIKVGRDFDEEAFKRVVALLEEG